MNNKENYTHPDDSILNAEWVDPERPYSGKEMQHHHDQFFKSLRMSPQFVCHEACGHKYYVKENGVKFKELKESETLDVGNCSICWKLRQTPRHLKKNALDFIDLYHEHFPDLEHPVYTYFSFEIERILYVWLYTENF